MRTRPCSQVLQFATDGFRRRGYVLTLGKQSIPMREFAEEVRELHIYTSFLRYHPEGEIVAKQRFFISTRNGFR